MTIKKRIPPILLHPSSGPFSIDQAAKRATQIYVGNIPHATLAQDLVKYLHAQVLALFPSNSTSASILRCQVKRKHNSTFAFVLVRSMEIAKALQHSPSLIFGGRQLKVRPVTKAKFQRPMGIEPGFECGGFQLCAEWPHGELTCLWAVSSDVNFQVSRFITARSIGLGLRKD